MKLIFCVFDVCLLFTFLKSTLLGMDSFYRVSQPHFHDLHLLSIGCQRWRSKVSTSPGDKIESKLFCKKINFDVFFLTVRISEHIQFMSSFYWFKHFLLDLASKSSNAEMVKTKETKPEIFSKKIQVRK